MTEVPPLILVDGSSYLYRAFHALPSLATADGQPTGAVYGVVNMVKKLIREYRPTHMAVVFDAKGKTFRDAMFPQYKATRPPMPDELVCQVEPLHELIAALGVPVLLESGVEADDVIATLACEASAQGVSVLISTGDKDLAQLVDGNVRLINTMTDAMLDRQGVIDKFGVAPEQIVDYLALIGDKVDNVPGVDGVGPKTAAKWLETYGSLDAIVAHASEFKGKIGDNLRAALAQLPLSRQLVTVALDLELARSPAELVLQPPDVGRLRALYQRLEFRTWQKELEAEVESGDPADSALRRGDGTDYGPYPTILTADALEDWIARLEQAQLFAIDTETTSLSYIDARIVGLSFALVPGDAAYLPLAHDYLGVPAQLDRDATLERLRPLLEDPARGKVGHNLKYDQSVLANHGVELAGIHHDTMLESYVLNSTASRHDMDTLSEKHLQHTTIRFEDVAGKGSKQKTFNQVPLEAATPYAAEDADVTLRLHQHFWPRLTEVDRLRSLYERIEIPLIGVLSRIERKGVCVDAGALARQSVELARRMVELEREAYSEAGAEFNLGSPKQLQEILFEKLQLPIVSKTPTGQPSTAEDVLQELAADYALPRLVLEHRGCSKLKSTYTDRLPQQINPSTGRVHTSYHQAVASTGRLSSSDPNLQNIPIRTEEGRRIRRAFVAPEGFRMIALDYSQIELRIMAHLSADEGLLRAFAEGRDIHRATAAEVFGVAPDEVDAERRRAAKAINFGLIYGMSAFGLARQLGVGRNEAQQYIDLYFSRYPGVKRYMEDTRTLAREQGYVETLFGRRLFVPEIRSRNNQRRQYAERTAINAPMQGSAADIIKRAMIETDAWLQSSAAPAAMIMQVHDELVLEAATDAVEQVTRKVRALMQDVVELRVPLVVEAGVGANWDEAH
ncbi:MAG: DNA polymerase I [Thiotrichales bacterium]